MKYYLEVFERSKRAEWKAKTWSSSYTVCVNDCSLNRQKIDRIIFSKAAWACSQRWRTGLLWIHLHASACANVLRRATILGTLCCSSYRVYREFRLKPSWKNQDYQFWFFDHFWKTDGGRDQLNNLASV